MCYHPKNFNDGRPTIDFITTGMLMNGAFRNHDRKTYNLIMGRLFVTTTGMLMNLEDLLFILSL